MFQVTTAIKKLYKLQKRKKVIQGGTSAGKTFGILPILIDRCIRTPMLETSVVSESIPHLRRGAMKDLLELLENNFESLGNGVWAEWLNDDQRDSSSVKGMLKKWIG